MMPRRLISLPLLVLTTGFAPTAWAQPVELASPNGEIAATITLDGQNQLRLTVRHDGATVVESSPLGVVVEDWTLGKQVQSMEPSEVTPHPQKYPTRGDHTTAPGRYRAKPSTQPSSTTRHGRRSTSSTRGRHGPASTLKGTRRDAGRGRPRRPD